MAGTIRMTPDDLRNAASFVIDKSGSITGEINSLESKVNEIKSQWEGAAQSEFFITFDEIIRPIKEKLPETLEGISRMLTGAADDLTAADEAISQRFRL